MCSLLVGVPSRARSRARAGVRNHPHGWCGPGIVAEVDDIAGLDLEVERNARGAGGRRGAGGGDRQVPQDLLAKMLGNVTASQKFKGMKSTHADAVAGEKVCPIFGTRPNAKFTWVVNGKPYEFCCPPCVDEFVKAAKESPASIKEPGDYLKK